MSGQGWHQPTHPYKDGPIRAVMGSPVAKALTASSTAAVRTFKGRCQALKPGGRLVRQLPGLGDYVNIPRVEVRRWYGPQRTSVAASCLAAVCAWSSHVTTWSLLVVWTFTQRLLTLSRLGSPRGEALAAMRDKPSDLIKPVVVID